MELAVDSWPCIMSTADIRRARKIARRNRESRMQLHFRQHGEGPPLVLLHGLFGSHENLGSVARALADKFTVYGLDLRNHGRSPHSRAMDYATLAADVDETLDTVGVETASLLGHSLGGKTAMALALAKSQRVERLVVVDIAPLAYDRRHDAELDALRALDLDGIRSRKDADDALAGNIPNPAIRQFLLKNLMRVEGGFAWRIPLDTIDDEYASIAAAPASSGSYEGPALFIRGGDSNYIDDRGAAAIHEIFPGARIETVPGAAHWVHVDNPQAFIELVGEFLRGN